MEHAVQLQLDATASLSALREDPLCTNGHLVCNYWSHFIDMISDSDIQRWSAEVKEHLSHDFG